MLMSLLNKLINHFIVFSNMFLTTSDLMTGKMPSLMLSSQHNDVTRC